MKRFLRIALMAIMLYFVSYLVFRQQHIALSTRENKNYIIFPKDKLWIYYSFRSITYLDEKITGIFILDHINRCAFFTSMTQRVTKFQLSKSLGNWIFTFPTENYPLTIIQHANYSWRRRRDRY